MVFSSNPTSMVKFDRFFFRPGAGLENFIQSMQRLQKAVQFFNKHNQDSPEMAQVVSFSSLYPLHVLDK